MRTGEDQDTPLSSSRLQELLIGVLAAITVVGAALPWLTLAGAWQTAGSDGFGTELRLGPGLRLALAVQALPFISLQSGNHEVIAMAAAVGVVLLMRHRVRRSGHGMRWAPAYVVTALAVVVALLAALLRLGVIVYSQVGLIAEDLDPFVRPVDGVTALVVVVAPVVPVLGWVAVLIACALYRPVSGSGEDVVDGESDPVEEPSGQRRGQPPAEHHEAPARPVGAADIRADGASESGYDEFRFRR